MYAKRLIPQDFKNVLLQYKQQTKETTALEESTKKISTVTTTDSMFSLFNNRQIPYDVVDTTAAKVDTDKSESTSIPDESASIPTPKNDPPSSIIFFS